MSERKKRGSGSARRLVSGAELARIGEVSRAAVSKLGRSGALRPARVGSSYDLDHPAVVEWLATRGIGPSSSAPPSPPVDEDLVEVPGFGLVSRQLATEAIQYAIDVEIERAWTRGQRLVQHDQQLIDMDHPATRRFLATCRGAPVSEEELASLWDAIAVERAARLAQAPPGLVAA